MLCSSCVREEKQANSPAHTEVNEEGGRGGASSTPGGTQLLVSVRFCSHVGNPNHS